MNDASKMKVVALLSFMTFQSSAIFAQDDSKQQRETDGIWHPITAVLGGQEMDENTREGIVLKLEGQQYSVTVNGTPDKGTCEIDMAAKPARMTITGTVGPNQGKTLLAIFEFTTSDRMRVCYDVTGREFPSQFKSESGTTHYLVEYRKELPKGAELKGKVADVPDADVLLVRTTDNQLIRVRLNGIDAPELQQAFGDKVQEQLESLVGGQSVRVVTQGEDRVGQIIGDVYFREKDAEETDPEVFLNVNMVEQGLAWHFVRYAPDNQELAGAEKDARQKKAGLWSEGEPVAPWDWRRQEQEKRNRPRGKAAGGQGCDIERVLQSLTSS
ncbi:MAG: thermonuclease family protein [Planctomycetota bacterium]